MALRHPSFNDMHVLKLIYDKLNLAREVVDDRRHCMDLGLSPMRFFHVHLIHYADLGSEYLFRQGPSSCSIAFLS